MIVHSGSNRPYFAQFARSRKINEGRIQPRWHFFKSQRSNHSGNLLYAQS